MFEPGLSTHELRCPCAGKFFWFVFIIFLTLNLMCFYGIMAVYITPDLIVATVLSAFFYGFWCEILHIPAEARARVGPK